MKISSISSLFFLSLFSFFLCVVFLEATVCSERSDRETGEERTCKFLPDGVDVAKSLRLPRRKTLGRGLRAMFVTSKKKNECLLSGIGHHIKLLENLESDGGERKKSSGKVEKLPHFLQLGEQEEHKSTHWTSCVPSLEF